MRRWLIGLVLAGGCVDAAAPEAPAPAPAVVTIAPHTVTPANDRAPEAPGPDVCALAAELPGDNICSLICEPDVMKDQLLAEGMKAGTCYEFFCALPDSSSVTVGVCLPPPQ